MKFKKLFFAGMALTMAFGMAAMVGCGVTGDPYTFEAEDGELGGAAQVEEGKFAWAGNIDEQGDELTQVGYFTSEGATLTFNVTAEKAAKVELNFRLASATSDTSGLEMTGTDWSNMAYNGTYVIRGIDFAKQQVVKLTVNGEEVAMKGKLDELKIPIENMGLMQAMGVLYGTAMCNYQDVKVVVNLKEGANTIELAALGYTEEVEVEDADPVTVNYGVNIDKVIITSPVKLS